MSGVRIVVTGVGTISPLGLNARRHFERLNAGESAVETLDDPAYRNYPPLLRAVVHDFDRHVAAVADASFFHMPVRLRQESRSARISSSRDRRLVDLFRLGRRCPQLQHFQWPNLR